MTRDTPLLVLFILMVTVQAAGTTFIQRQFRKLDPGETLQGIEAQLVDTDPGHECSVRCSLNPGCRGQNQKENQNTCHIIEKSMTPGSEQNYTADQDNSILKTDNCYQAKCKNKATCLDGLDSYTCQCKPGFTGTHCEDVDDCHQNDACKNNGTCVDGNNTFICQCTQQWAGATCEDENDCPVINPCQNGGSCLDGDGTFTCGCPLGWIGDNCQEQDDCLGVLCQNNGTCVDGTNSYTCNCTLNFGGDHCENNCLVTWCRPSTWTGPNPVLYYPFETDYNIGTKGAVIEPGLVGSAVRTFKTGNKNAELLNMEIACIISIISCGIEGGALSFWVKPLDITQTRGPMASSVSPASGYSQGFRIENNGERMTVLFNKQSLQEFKSTGAKFTQDEWNHYVLTYQESVGCKTYLNGQLHSEDDTASLPAGATNTAEYRKVIVGSASIYQAGDYFIDELIFFNANLTFDDVTKLYNQHKVV